MTETATEIAAAGYANLGIGSHCAAWAYIEFQDESSTKILRIPNNDSRITNTVTDDKKVTYTVVISGSDSALTLPVTFAKALFKNSDSDEADVLATDDFTPATLSATGDSLTLTIQAGVLT